MFPAPVSSVPNLRQVSAPMPGISSVPKILAYVKPVPSKSTATVPVKSSSHAGKSSALQASAPAPGEVPATVPGEVPATVPGEVPATVPGEVPATVPGEVPATVPGEVPATVLGELPVTVSGEVPVTVPGEVPANVPGEVPVTVPGEVPANVPGEVPVTVPGEVPANVPGEVLVTVPGEVPRAVPREVPTINAWIQDFSLESAGTPVEEAWYTCWLNVTSRIVAVDSEMVQIKGSTSTMVYKCATVYVVDFFGGIILQRTVKHTPGSFVVYIWTQKVNGFNTTSLQNGMPLKDVSTEVQEQLTDKHVITVDGEMDFRCLPVGNFETFDLHQHWKQWDGCYRKNTVPPEKSYQRISLRRFYKHHFNADIQDGAHTTVEHAAARMKLFLKYLDIQKTNLSSEFLDDYDECNVIEIEKLFNSCKLFTSKCLSRGIESNVQ